MQYRETPGDLDDLSALSFGTNRLPKYDSDAVELIEIAIQHGVNLIDTSAVYDDGRAEKMVGRAVGNMTNYETKVATKLPTWEVEEYSDMGLILQEQLARLETDQIDFYLFHALDWQEWQRLMDLDLHDWIKEHLGSEFKHLGFSYAGSRQGFRKLITTGYFDLTMVQFNWLDYSGFELVNHASKYGVAVSVLRPLREGALIETEDFVDWPTDMDPVERSLKYLWDIPETSTVTVGTSSLEHLYQNLEYANNADRSLESQSIFSRAQEKYYKEAPVMCYGCGDCLPCPEDIWIERNFKAYNDSVVLGSDESRTWEHLQGHSFEQCTDCGVCLERCPMDLDIPDRLEETRDYFEES